jgi:hypothetical protein
MFQEWATKQRDHARKCLEESLTRLRKELVDWPRERLDRCIACWKRGGPASPEDFAIVNALSNQDRATILKSACMFQRDYLLSGKSVQ